ncbi:MAG: DNA polymerase III subunit alpha [Phycisphaerales bacterium]|nr:DNA polymerase III subunit alpha [Phycisphaerales bacterium]
MTATPTFAHLHLHTEYSLLDGGNQINRLLDRVADLGMTSVAITDHGNLHGCVELYHAARKRGIKPILGIEAYVARGDRRVRRATGVQDKGDHLVLLAENETGWRNLMKLSSDSFREGFYYKPRMDHETLSEWSEGLIAINGHLGSSIAWHLQRFVENNGQEHWDAAVAEATWHAGAFGANAAGEPCFFVELQRNGVPEQDAINPHLIRLARELDLPLVCDNDVHFLNADDHDAHDTLCCISMQKTKDDPNRLHYPTDIYLKSPEDMAELFTDLPEVIENAARIGERCNVTLDFDVSHVPLVKVNGPTEEPTWDGEDLTNWYQGWCDRFELLPFDESNASSQDRQQVLEDCNQALRQLCRAGLIWRYGVDGITDAITSRFERELKILEDKHISAYFLIVWDFVNWAHKRGIPASARGSGVGTMVGYVLGLSNACPVEHGLLFERFTDPDRSEYPDIDIDICQNGRADVIDYVRDKYGHVAQIITFGRLKARAAIKDVSRVHGLAPHEGQRLANLVPNELQITIEDAIAREPELQSEYDSNPTIRKILDTARALEGHARHAGVHAAGVVIATQPLDTIVPLCRATGSDDIVTQWDGPTCESVGLLKMDFLGLRTLSTIELARTMIRDAFTDEQIRGAVNWTDASTSPLDLDRMTYEDQRVLELFRRGDTSGIFQFESGGMRKLLREIQPDRIQDIIAANALFRPGPMDLMDEYCSRKHGRMPVEPIHPVVDDLTNETYGIMVYQEQVMQILHGLGDIPLRNAYTLIKAISKKKHDVIDSQRSAFIDGAVLKGLDASTAEQLFEHILKFAGYGFNKSHSTCYAIIAYQTAWLKTYFPVQYMAALLTFESGAKKTEDWAPYLEDCRHTLFPDSTDAQPHEGIEIMPPDINVSHANFTVAWEEQEPCTPYAGHIRFGIGAIKGVGRSAIDTILGERTENGPFESLFDLCSRLSSRTVNRATIEALVQSGAMDSLHGTRNRAAMLAALDDAIATGQRAASDRAAGQETMFGMFSENESPEDSTETSLPNVPPWDRLRTLAAEREYLGFHISGHPLESYETLVSAFATSTIGGLSDLSNEQPVIIAGVISHIRTTIVQRGRMAGEKMAVITLQDRIGSVEGVLFSNAYRQNMDCVLANEVVFAEGRIDTSRGETQLIVENLFTADTALHALVGTLELNLSCALASVDEAGRAKRMDEIAAMLRRSNGSDFVEGGHPAEIVLSLPVDGKLVHMRTRHKVVVDSKLLTDLRVVLQDEQAIRIRGRRPAVAPRKKRRYGKREQVGT